MTGAEHTHFCLISKLKQANFAFIQEQLTFPVLIVVHYFSMLKCRVKETQLNLFTLIYLRNFDVLARKHWSVIRVHADRHAHILR